MNRHTCAQFDRRRTDLGCAIALALLLCTVPARVWAAACDSLTVDVAASADDGQTHAADGAMVAYTGSATTNTVGIYEAGGIDNVKVVHLRFNTAALPDAAQIVKAYLDVLTTAVTDAGGGRALVGRFTDGETTPFANYLHGPSISNNDVAIADVLVSTITVSSPAYYSFELASPGIYVDRQGYTGIALGVSGNEQPTASNGAFVNIVAQDHATLNPPRLRIYYLTPATPNPATPVPPCTAP